MIRGELQMNPMSRFIQEIPRELVDTEDDRPVKKPVKAPESPSFFAMKDAFRSRRDLSYLLQSSAVTKGAPAAGGEPDYKVGDTVSHVKFGTGTVLEIKNAGRDYEVAVDFDGKVRRMFASFAKLRKL